METYLKRQNFWLEIFEAIRSRTLYLDFYCAKIRLGIEVDGEVHNEKERKMYDKDREDYLNALSINLIRFWNNDVLNNTKETLNELKTKIKSLIKK